MSNKTDNIYRELKQFWGRRVIGISGSLIWSKPWWNWYLTPVVNFGKVRRAQLEKSTLLTSSLVPLGSFQIFEGLSDAKESGVRKVMGSYRTYSSLVKLQPKFLSLQWKTCLWAELQPWCLSFAVNDLPLGRTLMMMMMMLMYGIIKIIAYP